MDEALTVVLVLRATNAFTPAVACHVIAGVEHHWPYAAVPLKIVVLSDQAMSCPGMVRPLQYPWPGWWSKMELFSPAHEDLGDILYLDLDSIVVGSLEDVVKVRRLTLLRDFYRPARLGSGMMLLPREARPAVWARWIKEPDYFITRFRGDQEFLSTCWDPAAVSTWQDVLPGQVVSYKVHVRGKGLPAGARVVCFHGRPRHWDLTEAWMDDCVW